LAGVTKVSTDQDATFLSFFANSPMGKASAGWILRMGEFRGREAGGGRRGGPARGRQMGLFRGTHLGRLWQWGPRQWSKRTGPTTSAGTLRGARAKKEPGRGAREGGRAGVLSQERNREQNNLASVFKNAGAKKSAEGSNLGRQFSGKYPGRPFIELRTMVSLREAFCRMLEIV